MWLSADGVFDSGDRFLGRVDALVPRTAATPGAAPASAGQQFVFDVPDDLAAGSHQLLVVTNPEGLLER